MPCGFPGNLRCYRIQRPLSHLFFCSLLFRFEVPTFVIISAFCRCGSHRCPSSCGVACSLYLQGMLYCKVPTITYYTYLCKLYIPPTNKYVQEVGLTKMLGKTTGAHSTHTQKGKRFIIVHARKNVVFESQPC